MNRKGFTLVELLVAVVISMIIVGALTSLFVVGNRTFTTNKQVADITDEVRNAITTLDFLFSRWGAGVPCPESGCNIQAPPPDCTSYPPSDPMCITINGSEITFYANLYGIGFVQSLNNNNANIISCRLSSHPKQNCYYVWSGGTLKGGYNNGRPRYYSFSTFSGSPDCIKLGDSNSINFNLSVSRSLTEQSSQNPQTLNLEAGDYISRVPHKIKLYIDEDQNKNRYLMMERIEEIAEACNDDENSVVRLARVSSFSVQKTGRSIRLDITFIDEKGKTFSITRYYGR